MSSGLAWMSGATIYQRGAGWDAGTATGLDVTSSKYGVLFCLDPAVWMLCSEHSQGIYYTTYNGTSRRTADTGATWANSVVDAFWYAKDANGNYWTIVNAGAVGGPTYRSCTLKKSTDQGANWSDIKTFGDNTSAGQRAMGRIFCHPTDAATMVLWGNGGAASGAQASGVLEVCANLTDATPTWSEVLYNATSRPSMYWFANADSRAMTGLMTASGRLILMSAIQKVCGYADSPYTTFTAYANQADMTDGVIGPAIAGQNAAGTNVVIWGAQPSTDDSHAYLSTDSGASFAAVGDALETYSTTSQTATGGDVYSEADDTLYVGSGGVANTMLLSLGPITGTPTWSNIDGGFTPGLVPQPGQLIPVAAGRRRFGEVI